MLIVVHRLGREVVQVKSLVASLDASLHTVPTRQRATEFLLALLPFQSSKNGTSHEEVIIVRFLLFIPPPLKKAIHLQYLTCTYIKIR